MLLLELASVAIAGWPAGVSKGGNREENVLSLIINKKWTANVNSKCDSKIQTGKRLNELRLD